MKTDLEYLEDAVKEYHELISPNWKEANQFNELIIDVLSGIIQTAKMNKKIDILKKAHQS